MNNTTSQSPAPTDGFSPSYFPYNGSNGQFPGIYAGQWVKGLPEGIGIWKITSGPHKGDEYFGEWRRGRMEGRGTYTWPDGSKYEGEWKADKREGHGTFTWSDGEKYEGEFKANMPEGHGTLTWPDGRKYEGEWKAGKMEGHGTYTASNGRKFTGNWSNRKLNGKYDLDDLDKQAKRLGNPSSSLKVEKPPRNGAVFVQGKSGFLYLMEPQNQRREVHQIILQRMPEEDVNAGYISPDGDINQTSGKVNQRNFGERSLNDNLVGHICAERVQFHYEKGNIMWV